MSMNRKACHVGLGKGIGHTPTPHLWNPIDPKSESTGNENKVLKSWVPSVFNGRAQISDLAI